ncbi:ABC transporter ATP-binding protein [Ahrensia sp. R2A130]|uniref:ABC transporter ATP-binding protein n=1 Tax=Ahrensia sp. R2A130 TaxID=744979 RepID=UPI0001E0C326|nr:ABC transporter ATP-binding protein [Ahrensia sp. R2A130]EFL90798.1 hemin import ATP-binding protein HmuV [Ahrensia sp. R2A130]
MTAADTSTANVVLELSGVGYLTPAGKPLVGEMDMSVQRGEIVAIVGPNGAGKTTLIRMITALAKATSGTILISGLRLDQMSFAERARRIAYVGQSDEPDGRLTVRQYVSLGALPLTPDRRDRVSLAHLDNAIEAVGLSPFAASRMDSLSGGERQKAKIARAMCQQPELLVLDEPTNHLDPQARGELLGLVADMGISVVVALHDLTLIETFADKVAVMQAGQLSAFGTPQDVLSPERVQDVFNVTMHRFQHPGESRFIPALDIQIARPSNRSALNS